MDFGMPFLLETQTQEECIALCNRLGLQFIEWNMNFPQCQLDNFNVDTLNCIRKEKGLYFTIHLDESLNISDFNCKVRNAYLETVLESIELAKQIEAPIINMHLAKGIFITLPEKKEFLFHKYNQFYMQNMLEFRNVCEHAIGDSDIKIAVENTDGFAQHEKDAIELLLESKCFGLTLDIGHSHAASNADMPFYEKHLNKLIHMHIHDAKGNRNHLALGDGEIDLKHFLGMARDIGARMVLETKTIDALKKTIQYIEKKL